MSLKIRIKDFYQDAEKYLNITRKDFLDEVVLPDGIVTYNTSVLTEELEKKHGKIQDGESIATMICREYGNDALQWLIRPK